MKVMKKFRPPVEPRSFGSGVIVGCFIVSMAYVMMSKSGISMDHLSTLNCLPSSSPLSDAAPMNWMAGNSRRIQLSGHEDGTQGSEPTGIEDMEKMDDDSSPASASEVPSEEEKNSSTGNESDGKEEEGIDPSCESNTDNCKTENDREVLEERSSSAIESRESDGAVAAERKPMCDFSEYRLDICDVEGDVRIIGKNLSSVMLVVTPPSDSDHTGNRNDNSSWRMIKPYPRKYDRSAMAKVRAWNLTSLLLLRGDRAAPRCTVNHTVPGILFSTGGHCGNCFHDFADVLVPLFQTAGPLQGRVQFIVTDHQGWWMYKYRPYLKRLSSYDVIDLDNDEGVHCFKHAVVGLRAERDLMIDSSRAPKGYSIMDFVELTRSLYNLERHRAPVAGDGKKPRLLFIARGGTRKFVNMEEVVAMAKEVGYEVVVSEPDFFDVARFAHIVNSCDVMVGVHGAGMTNFLFLPTNAIVIQVVPLGKLDWVAANFYAEPAMGMNLRYLQYDISVEESTLVQLYPRDHPVFKDPESIHKGGWSKLGDVYLKQQSVKLDVNRFRPVLEKALQLLHERK